jgi:heme O synthase-like polyprenyltransferase
VVEEPAGLRADAAAHQLTPAYLVQSLLAFVAFCLVASSTYVLNDLLDLAADRAHPRKRNRPFRLGVGQGQSWHLDGSGSRTSSAERCPAVGARSVRDARNLLAATTLYSFWLKRIVAIDVCVLAGALHHADPRRIDRHRHSGVSLAAGLFHLLLLRAGEP